MQLISIFLIFQLNINLIRINAACAEQVQGPNILKRLFWVFSSSFRVLLLSESLRVVQ